jgi:xanthine dehydrogenase YagT iron-sulfur-binding subunit
MENSRKKKKTVTRRAFLQSLSSGAVGAGVASRVLGKEPRSIQSGPGEMEVFSSKRIALTVNGKKVGFETEPGETLLQVLRDRLRLTGAKRTCNRGECGGCTVLLDGNPVYSCHILAIQAEGKDILTNPEALAQSSIVLPQIAQIFKQLAPLELPKDVIDIYEAKDMLLETWRRQK